MDRSRRFAEEPVRSETVKFYDLKVDTPASVQALYSRIPTTGRRRGARHRASRSDDAGWGPGKEHVRTLPVKADEERRRE
jgi:hypothetical protein